MTQFGGKIEFSFEFHDENKQEAEKESDDLESYFSETTR